MKTYCKIVVDVDGSEVSEIAVRRAADIAVGTGAELVLVCAYDKSPIRDVEAIADILKEDGYLVRGMAPVDGLLRTARECALARGAGVVVRRAVPGWPEKVLVDVAAETAADLLVVGDRGAGTAIGRRLGRLPDEVARKSRIDVLVVYATGAEIRPYGRSDMPSGRWQSHNADSLLRAVLPPRVQSIFGKATDTTMAAEGGNSE
ncbi:universal stress protein [Nocardia arizonensis]|nr:universal stress protein [Nocardia arizonensis]